MKSIYKIIFLTLIFIGSVSYEAKAQIVVYTPDYSFKTVDGISYARTKTAVKWASDNVTKTTTYTYADRRTHVVVANIFPTIDSTVSGIIKTTVATYGNGKKITTKETASLVGGSVPYNSDYSSKSATYQFLDSTTVDVSRDLTKTQVKWDKANLKNINTYTYADKSKFQNTSRIDIYVDRNWLGASYKTGNANQTSVYLQINDNSNTELVTPLGAPAFVSDVAWYKEVTNNKLVYNGLSSESKNFTGIYNRVAELDYNYLYKDTVLLWNSNWNPYSSTTYATDKNGFVIALNEVEYGFNHVGAGFWSFTTNCPTSGCNKNFGTINGYIGAGAYGYQTPGSNIPTSGSKSFSGYTLGGYVNEGGRSYLTSSGFSANTNFATRSINISTYGTFARDSIADTLADHSNLNWSGTMSYSPGNNNITGTGSTTGYGLTGSLKANFFGPTANEFGGSWAFTNGNQRYIGAFAGK